MATVSEPPADKVWLARNNASISMYYAMLVGPLLRCQINHDLTTAILSDLIFVWTNDGKAYGDPLRPQYIELLRSYLEPLRVKIERWRVAKTEGVLV
jgi:hypothetical protein